MKTTTSKTQLADTIINIQIKRNNGSCFNIQFDKFDTVLSLKESLFELTGYNSGEIRLVFNGQVLKDEMSLSFYNIKDNSQVYFVPAKPKRNFISENQSKPYKMMNRLMKLLEDLPNTPAEDYSIVVSEIYEIMEHPVIQSFARINPDVKQIFADAKEIIANTERPTSRKTKDFIARSKDMVFDQFDQSPDGLRILQSFLEESEEAYAEALAEEQNKKQLLEMQKQQKINNRRAAKLNLLCDQPINTAALTNVNYHKNLSSKPLPNPWSQKKKTKNRSVFQNAALRMSVATPSLLFKDESTRTDDDLSGFTKQSANSILPSFQSKVASRIDDEFADQVATLKKKGFKDEKTIIQALSEANGNVQLAEQLLKNKHF